MPTTQYPKIAVYADAAVRASISLPNPKMSHKLVGPAGPNVYVTPAHYHPKFCNSVQAHFNQLSGNTLSLSPRWREAHIGDSVETFIVGVTDEAWNQANGKGAFV